MRRSFLAFAALAAICSRQVFADDSSDDTDTEDPTDLSCRTIEQIFPNGEALCNKIFGTSFKYIPKSNDSAYQNAYTMWFFETENPNDKITAKRFQELLHDPNYMDINKCYLRAEGTTGHVEHPQKMNTTFTECVPFRNNACCEEKTVENKDTINNAYGTEYRWDRCGKLSQQCERFFVQEACFYECDRNVGLFRKYTPQDIINDPSLEGEEWVVENMPIQGDYCDAWYDACRFDSMCGDGDFFSCARIPPVEPVTTVLSPGAIAGVVIGCIVLVAALCFLIVLIRNERKGTPVFQKMHPDDSRPLDKPTGATVGDEPNNDHITTI